MLARGHLALEYIRFVVALLACFSLGAALLSTQRQSLATSPRAFSASSEIAADSSPAPSPLTQGQAIGDLLTTRDTAEALVIDVSDRVNDKSLLTPIRTEYALLQGKANGFVDYLVLSVRQDKYDAATASALASGVKTQADVFAQDVGKTHDANFSPFVLKLFQNIGAWFGIYKKVRQDLSGVGQADRETAANQIKSAASWKSWDEIMATASSKPQGTMSPKASPEIST